MFTLSGFTLLAVGLLVYLLYFQPPFYFPKPTGQYAVGVKIYHWIDTKRKEILAEPVDLAHPYRELMVNVWYPAEGVLPGKPVTPYAPYLFKYLKKISKKNWLLYDSRPVFSYAQPGISLAIDGSRYPVIIFSHGAVLTRDSNTIACEELASHGYIVIGIGHTYDSSLVQFSDGRIIDGKKSIAKRFNTDHGMEVLRGLNERVETWIADVVYVIDQIEKLNNDQTSFLYHSCDMQKIGMFGHSFGGAIAVHVGNRDSRVKAIVDLDGFLFGPDIQKKWNKPCMFMLSEGLANLLTQPWTPKILQKFGINEQEKQKESLRYLPAIEKFVRLTQHDNYTFFVRHTEHLTFCDQALLKHVPLFSCFLETDELGMMDGLRAITIINDYLVNFFDKYFKNKPSELLDGKDRNKYSEVERMLASKG